MPFSFISLVMASVDIFYTLRHGSFSEPDPSIKMVCFVVLFAVLLVLAPLSTLILIATYFHAFVIAHIFAIIIVNALIMKLLYFKERHLKRIKDLHISIKHKPFYDLEKVQHSSNFVFLVAIFTSWIAPCTVWFNNFEMKSYFLIILSTITMFGHSLGLLSIYMFMHRTGALSADSLPIFHCFTNEVINSNVSLQYTIQSHKDDSLIKICSTNCLPILNLCTENENPSDFFVTCVLPPACVFIFCSWLSSLMLQYLGNYYTMYNWSRVILCDHPIVHVSMIKDFIKNSKSSLSKHDCKILSKLLLQGLEEGRKEFFVEKYNNSSSQDDDLLSLAIWHDFPPADVNKIVALNMKYNCSEVNRERIINKLVERLKPEDDSALRRTLNELVSKEWSNEQQGTMLQNLFSCIAIAIKLEQYFATLF